MLELCGFSASNYYNVVKLAMLEKGLAFQEVLTWLDETDSSASPLGKVPYLRTEDGPLCETSVILDYLEARYPESPLLPPGAYPAAKVLELQRFLDLHIELVARNLYLEAFFGGKVSDVAKASTEKQLEKNIAALGRLVQFSPFIAGPSFSLADCTAAAHLPLVLAVTKQIYGRDMLADLPVRDYLKRLAERPTVQRVAADRKANTEQMMQRIKAAQAQAAQS